MQKAEAGSTLACYIEAGSLGWRVTSADAGFCKTKNTF